MARCDSPVEIRDLFVLIANAQVVEHLLVLAEQADVVGGGERHLREARDALHQPVLVNMDPEIRPVFH